MNGLPTKRLQIIITVVVLLAEAAHLAWEHFHGGILSHHLLNRSDLPSASNAWGLLLLPVLAWVLSGFALRRAETGEAARRSVLAGFVAGLAIGGALALAFTFNFGQVASLLFQGLLLLALVFRVYRGECLLGFVLGMTFTFGAVLPTLIGGIIALLSAIAHRIVYPLASRAWLWLGQR